MGWVARTRRRLVVDDVTADARVINQEWWRRWSMRGFVAYPVVAGDQLLAVLCLSHGDAVQFTPDLAEVIDMLVGQASVAIQNARLYHEAQRRRDVAEALARVSRELTGTLEAERIAALVTQGIVDLLAVQASIVFRYEPEDGSLHQIASHGAATTGHRLVLRAGEGVAGRAVAERKVIVTADVFREPRVEHSPEQRATLDRLGVGAMLAIPLFTHDQILGALSVGSPVLALANPGGHGLRTTFGLVTATGRSFRGPRGRRIPGSVEHSAPLPRGSSGGPLVDPDGRLLGLNAVRREGGLILAVPADDALQRRVDALARGESAERPRLGVALAHPRAARKLRAAVGLPERDGLLVRGVAEDSPASRAGIERGDLLVAAGGKDLRAVDDLFDALEGDAPTVTLRVLRGTEERDVEVTLS